MKYLQLQNGNTTIVDDEDYDWLSQWDWFECSKGYIRRSYKQDGKNVTIRMHRLLTNAPLDKQVDHINGDKRDNRKLNLRLCNNAENVCNQPKRNIASSASKYKGVSRIRKLWMSRITKDSKVIHLGNFRNELHAAMAYDIWAKDLHGEFANLNF